MLRSNRPVFLAPAAALLCAVGAVAPQADSKKGRAISVGHYAYPTQIDMLPSGLAIVVSPYEVRSR